jgi:Ribbon-helix-helix protein, copG family
MATNLRLTPEVEQALRQEAERTGRSQQEVIREAIGRHLGLTVGRGSHGELGVLVSSGTVKPPRTPYRRVAKRLVVPAGVSSTDLLDRGDRL